MSSKKKMIIMTKFRLKLKRAFSCVCNKGFSTFCTKDLLFSFIAFIPVFWNCNKLRKTAFVRVMSVWIVCLGEWFDPWWFWKSHKIMCVLLSLYYCHLLQLLLQWACNLRLWFYLQIRFNRRLLFIIHNDHGKVLKKRQTKFENTKKYLKRPRTTSYITLCIVCST